MGCVHHCAHPLCMTIVAILCVRSAQHDTFYRSLRAPAWQDKGGKRTPFFQNSFLASLMKLTTIMIITIPMGKAAMILTD